MRNYLIITVILGLFCLVPAQGNWCKQNETFNEPAAGTCRGYWECLNGQLSYKRCPTLYTFDSVLKKCSWNPLSDDSVPCSTIGRHLDDSWCSVGKTYKSPVVGACEQYYHCQNGNLQLASCTWPTSFNPHERICQLNIWPFHFTCQQQQTTGTSTTQIPTTPNPYGFSCDKGQNFQTGDSADCNKYYKCDDGHITRESCGYFEKFDVKTSKCSNYLYPWNKITCANEKSTSTPVPDIHTSPQPSTPTPKVTDKTTASTPMPSVTTPSSRPVEIDVPCLKANFFKKPYPSDCQKYYKCNHGNLTIESCAVSYRFDPLSHECKFNIPWIKPVNCSAKPEKPVCEELYKYRDSYPGNPDKYYDCNNKTLTVQDCGMLKKYNPKTEQCEYHIFSFALNKDPVCTVGQYFNTSFPGDCHLYLDCFNGTLTTSSCYSGQKYDKASSKCIVMTQCDLFTCSAKGPVCLKGVNYKTPLKSGDCSEYAECQDEKWTIKKCSWLHKFDPTTLECRLSFPLHRVDCTSKAKCSNAPIIQRAVAERVMTLKAEQKPRCNNDENFKAPVPTSHSKYYNCNNGKLEIESCDFWDRFDPKLLACRVDTPWDPIDYGSMPGEPHCSTGQEFKSVYPGQCEKYYDCKNGTLKVEKCYFWQKFDPATLECRMSVPYVYSVNCSSVSGSKVKRETAKNIVKVHLNNKVQPNKVAEPSCHQGKDFKSVYPGDCKKYFDCSNGTVKVEQCFWLRKFDPATLSCKYDLPFFRVNCSAIPGSALPVFPESVKSRCSGNNNFTESDRSDCKSYYLCSSGKLTYQTCGLMKKFDPTSRKCSFDLPFDRVNCTALSGQPNCPKTGLKLEPYPGHCSQYYECKDGTLTVKTCDAFKKFDSNLHDCIYELPFRHINCAT